MSIKKLKILFIGDIVGEQSLEFVLENMKTLQEKYSIEYIIANGENIENGKGLNEEHAQKLFDNGVNVITTGNHIWDNWRGRPLLSKDSRVIRPLNYPHGNAGYGFNISQTESGVKIGVLQLQGRTFLQTIDCPFKAADIALKKMKEQADIIIVDFHAEATAEKMAMGWHLDGKVTAMVGTHTHIPTADANILPNGTAYITDVGMSGPFNSVVGMRTDVALKRFTLQTAHKYEMAEGDIKINGAVIEADRSTGQAISIEHFAYPKFIKSVFDNL